MRILRLFTIALAASFCISTTSIQAQSQWPAGSTSEAVPADGSRAIDLSTLLARTGKTMRRGFSLQPGSRSASSISITPMAAGPSLPVMGSGTVGRLTKWAGFTSSNSVIGDTTIYEDKFGKVGIGTDSPTSRLTVAGVIESTGGFKFPDGSVKTSARVIHDATLTGEGTPDSPLSAVQSEALIEPIRQSITFSIPSGEFFASPTIYTVPTGKRLVIEHSSASCGMPPGQRVNYFSILTQPNGGPRTLGALDLVPVFVGDFPGESAFRASTPMKLYGHSETTVEVIAGRRVTTGQALCSFTISGFLVDLPSRCERERAGSPIPLLRGQTIWDGNFHLDPSL